MESTEDGTRQIFKLKLSNGKEIKVKEMSVANVLAFKDLPIFSSKEDEEDKGLLGLLEMVKPLFAECVEGLTFEELKDLFPSEIKNIWEEFKKVNFVFFEVVQGLGLNKVLDEILNALKSDFIGIYAGLSREAIKEP